MDRAFSRLWETVTQLTSLCAWTKETTAEELVEFLRSEVDEVESALEDCHKLQAGQSSSSATQLTALRQSTSAIEEEIGDTVFNVLMLAAALEREFPGVSGERAVARAAAKVRRRSPHVFDAASGVTARTKEDAQVIWQSMKSLESKGQD